MMERRLLAAILGGWDLGGQLDPYGLVEEEAGGHQGASVVATASRVSGGR